MSAALRIAGPTLDASADVERILRTLPRWFGIETALREYVDDARRLPTFVLDEGDAIVGFITLRQHAAASWEVHGLGIDAAHRGRGLGRALHAHAAAWLQAQGATFLQVKTVGESHPSAAYAETRAFYAALGYVPLETFQGLWGPSLPVLQLVKRLDDVIAPTPPVDAPPIDPPLEVEFGHAGSLDTQGTGWFIGFSDWARSPSGLRHMPAEAGASGLCVKWYDHPAGHPNGDRKPISEGRTISMLVGAPSEFRIECSCDPDFAPSHTVAHVLRRPGDFVIWGAGLHHRTFGLRPASMLTIRWTPNT